MKRFRLLLVMLLLAISSALPASTVKLHIDVGLNHFYKQRYLEAYKEFKAAVDAAPNNAEAHFNLGRVYQVQGFLKEAIVEYQIAVKLDPSYLAANRALESLRRQLEKDVAANLKLKGQEEAAQLRGSEFSAGSHEERGQELLRQGRLADAVVSFSQAARQQPFNSRLQKVLGFLHFRQGKYRQAIDFYEQARKLAPNDVEIDYAMGLIRIRTREFEEAVVELRRAVERSPEMVKAHYALGEAYEGLGQNENATFQFRKCLELNPQLQEAQDKLKELGGRLAYTYFSRGSYFYQQGDYEKAEALLSLARQYGSLSPEQNRQIDEMLGAAKYWINRRRAEDKVKSDRRDIQQSSHITKTIKVEDVTLNPTPYMGTSVDWSGWAIFEDSDRGRRRFFVNTNPSVNADENLDFAFGILFPKALPDDPRISIYSEIQVKGKIVKMEKALNNISNFFSQRRQPILEASEITFTRKNYDQPLTLRFF